MRAPADQPARNCRPLRPRWYNGTVDIRLDQLPIPDWGLLCPTCRYPLVGLPTHRCPECGTDIDISALVRPWTRLRPPRFTGAERPLPDFGLSCAECGAALAGAAGDSCPECGTPFDLERLRPARDWFIVETALVGRLSMPGVQSMLAAEKVPYVPVNEKSIGEIYAGHGVLYDRLRAPAEFFFEILWLLRQAREDLEAVRTAAGPPWLCADCGEENPGHFDICWNCEAARP